VAKIRPNGLLPNFNDPDFLLSILSDLTKLKFHLRKTMAPAVVVDSLELVCGSGYSQEKVAQTVNAGWAADPVHPNKHIYAKAALNLMEKMANSRPVSTGSGSSQSRKRNWSASNSGGSPAGSSGGRSNGGGESGSSGGRGGYGGGGGSGKKAHRSQQWQEMRRWNDRQDGGSYQHGGRERGNTAAAAPATGRTIASRSSPGSTAAGTTAVITAGEAGTTATTTSSPLKEGRVAQLYF
jgi:hypothetical protein